MDTQLTLAELDSEAVALLPSKETLGWGTNWTSIYASNSSMALNAATFNSYAASQAVQQIQVNN